MKKIILPIVILLTGCLPGKKEYAANTKEALAWIRTHKKPIVVGHSSVLTKLYLMDADMNCFTTKPVDVALYTNLPDTIK